MKKQTHVFLDIVNEEFAVAVRAVRAILEAGAADAEVLAAAVGALDRKIGRMQRLYDAYAESMIPYWRDSYATMLRRAYETRAALFAPSEDGSPLLPHRMHVVLGDWSGDGHGRSKEIEILTSHPVAAMRTAYEASVARTGLTFDHQHPGVGICVDYEEDRLLAHHLALLKQAGYDTAALRGTAEDGDDVWMDEDKLLNLLMWFVGLSLDGFRWRRAPGARVEDCVRFNGYWGPLNVQIGYGIYS